MKASTIDTAMQDVYATKADIAKFGIGQEVDVDGMPFIVHKITRKDLILRPKDEASKCLVRKSHFG